MENRGQAPARNGLSDEYELDFDETGETTGHFTATIYLPIDGPALGGNLNLVLPPDFDPDGSEIVTMYIGNRDPGDDDYPLAQTSPYELAFNGDASWADVSRCPSP